MKRVRALICVIFAASCTIFSLYIIKIRQLEDHTPPVITCEEDTISVSVSAEEQELLQGVTAEDNKDGDITESVRVSTMSHFIEKGKRTITYIAFDKANQAGTAQRTVLYTDYVSPKIYLSEPLRCSVSDVSGANLLENMTAEDCLDGDLTKQLRITVGDGFYSIFAGNYDVTVQVTNSAGDVRVIPMIVTTVDNSNKEEGLKFYPMLSEYIVYTKVGQILDLSSFITGLQKGTAKYAFNDGDQYLTATESDIEISNQIDYSKPGTYQVEYSYTSQEGIKAITRMYVIVEE